MLSFTKKGHESIYIFQDTIWFVEKNTVKYHTYIFIFIQYTNLDCSHLFIHNSSFGLFWDDSFAKKNMHQPNHPPVTSIHTALLVLMNQTFWSCRSCFQDAESLCRSYQRHWLVLLDEIWWYHPVKGGVSSRSACFYYKRCKKYPSPSEELG